VYRKRHPAIRRSKYTAGASAPVFIANEMKIGVVICLDSTDLALVGDAARAGAQILVVPTNNAMSPKYDPHVNDLTPALSIAATRSTLASP
jgi:predicted amidohydrolase